VRSSGSFATSVSDPVAYTSEYYSPDKGPIVTGRQSPSFPAHSETVASQSSNDTGILSTAGQTARQYLPTSVIGALEGVGVMGGDSNNATLPSQDTTFKPTVGGVGSLPGTASETDVAKLPEERTHERTLGKPLGREGVMGTIADDQNVDSLASKTEKKDWTNTTDSATTGTKTASQFIDSNVEPFPASGDGVALQHVARPDVESTEHPRPLPTFISADLPASDKPNNSDGDVNKPLPPPGGNTNTFPDNHHDERQEKKTDDKPSNDSTYAEDQSKKRAPKTSPNHAYSPPASQSDLPKAEEGNKSDKTDSAADKSSTSSDTKPSGKPSLTQKIKGEVKIIAGKLSKDPAKVESGQALKTGPK